MVDRAELRAGKAREDPANFHVQDVRGEPTPHVTLEWDAVDDALVRSDYSTSAEAGVAVGANRSAEDGAEAERIAAHLRTVQGYKLHRGATAGFLPDGVLEGQGNCLKDEGALPPMTTSYEDASVSPGQTLYYRVAAVVSE